MAASSQLRLVTDQPPAHQQTADPVRQVFEHWVFMFGLRTSTTKLGPKRKPAIAGALALGYSVADLMLAIDGMASVSLDGKPEGMVDRMREIDWFLADETRIERCIRHGQRLREVALETERAAQERSRTPQVEADPAAVAAGREALRALAASMSGRRNG